MRVRPDRFEAASLAVASIPVSVLVAFLAHDPAGWLGAGRTITLAGALVLAGLAVLASVGAVLGLTGRRGSRTAGSLGFGGLAAIAISLSATDPGVGLPALAWYAWVAYRTLFPRDETPGEAPAPVALQQLVRLAERSLSLLALLLLVTEFGYGLSSSPWVKGAVMAVAAMAFVVSGVAEMAGGKATLRSVGVWLGWVVFALCLAWRGPTWDGFAIATGLRQVIILARRTREESWVASTMDYLLARPAQLFVLSFAVLIALGGLLLSFPISSASSRPVPMVDALFTAASAVCVTGLTTVDTSTAYSLTGQGIVAVLIQVGGLGVITLSSFAAMLLSTRLGLRHQNAMGVLVDQPSPREMARLVRFIVVSTILIEAVGAAVLWLGFWGQEPDRPRLGWVSVFHAISAFCNAGFALQPDNLVPYGENPVVMLTVSTLIVLGGIGFPVLAGVGRKLLHRQKLSMHAAISISMTAALIAGGFVLLLLLEWDHAFGKLSVGGKLLTAVMHSVTLRTAGFNAVGMTTFRPATHLFHMVWMFIGGNSGSTAGGIKITTVAVLLLHAHALLRGKARVEAFSKTIPEAVIGRAAIVAMLGAFTVATGGFVLLLTQTGRYEEILFETVSAFGTVGLSLDYTPHLDGFGKVLVMGLMFIGRVGPLTLLLTMQDKRPSRLQYPTEDISVG